MAIGFTLTASIGHSEALFSPVKKSKMDETERRARFDAQRAGDPRTTPFGFVGQRVHLAQIITSTTDPAVEE
jgi:hypothetical protein